MHQVVNMIQAAEAIKNLDLERIVKKAQTKNQWSNDKAAHAEKRYRNFLLLFSTLEDGVPIIPTQDIDTVWHEHILDTHAYMDDCHAVFGYYLHHVPFFGQEEPDRVADLSNTEQAYEKMFGEKYRQIDLGWCCPKGRDCQGEGCSCRNRPERTGKACAKHTL
jgi:hypothetical protein